MSNYFDHLLLLVKARSHIARNEPNRTVLAFAVLNKFRSVQLGSCYVHGPLTLRCVRPFNFISCPRVHDIPLIRRCAFDSGQRSYRACSRCLCAELHDERVDRVRITGRRRNGLLVCETSSPRSCRQKLHVRPSPIC